MSAGLPLADPQFWLVTAGAAAIVAVGAWRLRRRPRVDAGEPPCARCAQAPRSMSTPSRPERGGGRR